MLRTAELATALVTAELDWFETSDLKYINGNFSVPLAQSSAWGHLFIPLLHFKAATISNGALLSGRWRGI